MKVFVNGVLHDANFGPIAIVFDDDAERKLVAEHIGNMAPIDDVRIYSMFPAGTLDIEGFMNKVYAASTGGKVRSATIHIEANK